MGYIAEVGELAVDRRIGGLERKVAAPAAV